MIGRIRRFAKRHGLRLVKERIPSDYVGVRDDRMYQLQAKVVVAGLNYELTLKDVLAICERLDGAR